MRKFSYTASSKGFTLIELLVVVGIVGVLSGISLGTINAKKQKEYAQDLTLKTSVEKACSAIEAYYEAEDATYPDAATEGGNPLLADTTGEILQNYITAWPEGFIYTTDGTDFSIHTVRSLNENFYVCGSNWPLVKECASVTDGAFDPLACEDVAVPLFQYEDQEEYVPQCGDGFCNGDETCSSCKDDCGPCCNNNNVCESELGEDYVDCIGDCHCGNGECDYGENYDSCSSDCDEPELEPEPEPEPEPICNENSICEPNRGENYANCLQDCHCGNGECDYGENYDSCSSDCDEPEPICNENSICEPNRGENYKNCFQDCHCGNKICDEGLGETFFNCSRDCPKVILCNNNGICEPQKGETITNCYNDCKVTDYCDDNKCVTSQDCSCPQFGDCSIYKCVTQPPLKCVTSADCVNYYCLLGTPYCTTRTKVCSCSVGSLF